MGTWVTPMPISGVCSPIFITGRGPSCWCSVDVFCWLGAPDPYSGRCRYIKIRSTSSCNRMNQQYAKIQVNINMEASHFGNHVLFVRNISEMNHYLNS